MLKVTRLDGSETFLNPDQVLWIEALKDTVITFTNGQKLFVKELASEVSEQFLKYKQGTQSKDATWK